VITPLVEMLARAKPPWANSSQLPLPMTPLPAHPSLPPNVKRSLMRA
jgi:hypothetical protein